MKFSRKMALIAMTSLLSVSALAAPLGSQMVSAATKTTQSVKRSKSVKLTWRKSMKPKYFYASEDALYSAHLLKRYGYLWQVSKSRAAWRADQKEKLQNKHTKKSVVYYHVVSPDKKIKGWISSAGNMIDSSQDKYERHEEIVKWVYIFQSQRRDAKKQPHLVNQVQ